MEDVDWTREWLVLSVMDYYAAAVALAIIALHSERSLLVGVLWSAGFFLLGGPLCLLYIVYRSAQMSLKLPQ